MTIAQNATTLERRRAMRAQTTLQLIRQSTALALCTQQLEAPGGGEFATVLPVPDFSDITATTRNRGDKPKEADVVSMGTKTVVRDQSWEVKFSIPFEDVPETYWPLAEQSREYAAAQAAKSIDENFAAFIAAQDYKAAKNNLISIGGGNANALTIARTSGGDYHKGNGNRLVAQAIRTAALHFHETVQINEQAIGGSPGTLFCYMHPRLLVELLSDMEDRNLHWDTMTQSTLDLRLPNSQAWAGRLYGIDIVTSTVLGVPASGADYSMYVGTRNAIAAFMDGPRLDVVSEPDTEDYSFRYADTGFYGRILWNDSLIARLDLNTIDAA